MVVLGKMWITRKSCSGHEAGKVAEKMIKTARVRVRRVPYAMRICGWRCQRELVGQVAPPASEAPREQKAVVISTRRARTTQAGYTNHIELSQHSETARAKIDGCKQD